MTKVAWQHTGVFRNKEAAENSANWYAGIQDKEVKIRKVPGGYMVFYKSRNRPYKRP